MIALDEISSLILCGGVNASATKTNPGAPFDGDLGSLPMVDYAIDRLPITLELLISANRNIEQYLLRGKVIQDSTVIFWGKAPLLVSMLVLLPATHLGCWCARAICRCYQGMVRTLIGGGQGEARSRGAP